MFSWDRFKQLPVVGIMRNIPKEQALNIARIYLEAGMTTLEVTMNSPDASDIINLLFKAFGGQLNIGAGSVCTLADLRKAVDAGASYIVTPIYDKTIVRSCVKRQLPIFCGAYTPTEIFSAWTNGANMVKIFPASNLGLGYIKDIQAPMNGISLLPTGGITPGNFISFLSAGASGVGMGSHLFPEKIRMNGNIGLKELYQDIVQQFGVFKSGKQSNSTI